MENMLAELENMKCMVDQVTGERDDAVERLADAGRLVKSKEQDNAKLAEKMVALEQKDVEKHELKAKNN